MSLVIRRRSWLTRLEQTVEQALPAPLRRLLEGKSDAVRLDDAEAEVSHSWLHSVDLLVPSDLVLRTRLSIPKSSRGDLPHAVDLMLHERTPFAREEVLVEAQEERQSTDDERAGYSVSILPRAVLDRAKLQLGIPPRAIGRISTVEPSGEVIETAFARALFPARSYTTWLPLLPVVLLVGAIAAYGTEDLLALQARIADLDTTLQARTVVAAALAKDADTRKKATSGGQSVMAAISVRPSVFSTLEAIRKLLPQATHVTGIETRSGQTKVSVRSANVLADMQSLSGNAMLGDAAIDGAITADPKGVGEIGTIVLQSRTTAK